MCADGEKETTLLRIGLALRHVTPKGELHSNLRLLCGNYLENKRLREKASK